MNNANLRPFQPGQSGNPGGRPKTTALKKAIRAACDMDDVSLCLVRALVDHAKRGNMQAMKILLACDDSAELTA